MPRFIKRVRKSTKNYSLKPNNRQCKIMKLDFLFCVALTFFVSLNTTGGSSAKSNSKTSFSNLTLRSPFTIFAARKKHRR